MQTIRTFHSSCDSACLKFKFLYNITTGHFQSDPLFEERHKFDQVNEFCLSQRSAVTIFRRGSVVQDKMHARLCQTSSGLRVLTTLLSPSFITTTTEWIYFNTVVSSVGEEDAGNSESCTEIHRHPRIGLTFWRKATVVRFVGICVSVAVDCIWRRVWIVRPSAKHTARESWSVERNVDAQTSVHCSK